MTLLRGTALLVDCSFLCIFFGGLAVHHWVPLLHSLLLLPWPCPRIFHFPSLPMLPFLVAVHRLVRPVALASVSFAQTLVLGLRPLFHVFLVFSLRCSGLASSLPWLKANDPGTQRFSVLYLFTDHLVFGIPLFTYFVRSCEMCHVVH